MVDLVNDAQTFDSPTGTALPDGDARIHYLGKAIDASDATIDIRVGITLSNGKKYYRDITDISMGLTPIRIYNSNWRRLYYYDANNDEYVDLGNHRWAYFND